MSAQNISGQIAKALLEIEAIKLSPNQPFTWSSGWKSPIYCDNRLSLSFPEIRTLVKKSLASRILEQFPQAEAIAGVATAGIPQGALVAEELNLPFIYVRSKAKGHGMENLIEGKATEGQKVVVIEDLISTGGSSLKAVDALRQAGIVVLGLAAIFTYGFPLADENFKAKAVDYFTLSDYSSMLKVALEEHYVSKDILASLENWRKDPANWKPD
ncbi:MAG: orotate phosphoribosyltransferase [Cyclobacteriaceae bacterium]